MLQNLIIIFIIIIFASQSLADLQQSEGSSILQCNNNQGFVNITDDNGTCRCSVTTPSVESSNGYIYTKGIGAHKLHKIGKTWNEARKICIEEGAHLAILDSVAEAMVLQSQLIKENKEIQEVTTELQAWLGYHDLFDEGEWVTIFGDSIESTGYQGWNNNHLNWLIQPDNTNGQHCASLIRDTGMMDDVQCHWDLAFFCEKSDNACS